jgi:hypothetical protein
VRCAHGRDVGFGSGCWECEEEKRRHQETLDVQQKAFEQQQEALQEQRRHAEEAQAARDRQEELLREAAYAHEKAAGVQRAQLALQQRQVEESRARQLAEDQRRALRAGLPEFSDDFRNAWQLVSADHDALQVKASDLSAELRSALQEEQRIKKDVSATWDEMHRDFGQDLVAKLAQGTPNMVDPPSQLDDPKSREELRHLAEGVREVGTRLRAPRAQLRSTDGPVLRLHRELSAVGERIDALAKAPPETPAGAMGCLAFLLVCVGLGIAGAIQQPGEYGIALLFYVVVAAIPAVIAARRFTLIGTISATLPQIDLLARGAIAALERIPDVEGKQPPAVDNTRQASRQDKLRAHASLVSAALHSTVTALLEMYKLANFKFHPKAQALAHLNSEWGTTESRTADIHARLAHSPEEAMTEESYTYLCSEIQRVGRLILDGRRVAGSRIELRRCISCGFNVSAETPHCPHCNCAV